MKVTRGHVLGLLAAAVVSPMLAACGGGDEPAAKPEQITGPPVTLRIGTDDVPGKPASDQIEELARRVARRSGGKLRIEPVWHAADDGPDWDQAVARMVTNGELDMGLIPSRAWDTEGVTSLRALNAPFLITNDALVADVVSGDLAGDLMAGLDKAGVVGVALFPEGLRHPFAFKRPLLGPEDYEGKTIRSPTSKTVAATFAALGARTNGDEPDPRTHAGLESSYVLNPGGTATGNVTYFPKVNALVVNEDAYAKLDRARRDVLAGAAAETRTWAIESRPDDAQAAREFCANGGAVVAASDADVAALQQATAPVYAELERDAATKRLIEAIRTRGQATTVAATAPVRCGGQEQHSGATALDGVYKIRTTDAELREFGITDPAEIAENHGRFKMTMSRGEYCWVQHAPNPLENPDECSTYEVDGDRLVLRFPSGQPDIYRWRKTAGGDLRLTVVEVEPGSLGYAQAWTAGGWQRVADAK